MAGKAVEPTVAELAADDAFGAAFDAALEPEQPAEEKPVEETPPIEEEKPVETPPEVVPPVVEPPKVDPAVAAMQAELAELKAKLAAPPAKEEPVVPEVDAEWEQFKKDWPEQAAIIEKREAATKKMVEELKAQIEETKAQLTPVVAATAESAQEQFMNAILAVHSDAVELHANGELQKWIDKQPGYLKTGIETALTQGTAQDVIDVFTAYRAENPKAEDPAAKAKAEAEAKAKQEKLDKLKNPGTVRTSLTTEPDPADFDSAFDAGVKALSA